MREEVHQHRRYWQGRVKVRRVGVDGTGVKMIGHPKDSGVLMVDDETGIGLWVETVDEQDPEALARTLAWVLPAICCPPTADRRPPTADC